MNKSKKTNQATLYESPVIQDINPVSVVTIQGDSNNNGGDAGDGDNEGGGGLGF